MAVLDARVLWTPHAEHLLINRDSDLFRLDVIEGTVATGPVSLRFDLAVDGRLPAQISALGRFCGAAAVGRRHVQLAQRLLALQAVDARDAGASLREVADRILGPGAWPGNGEHRKSLVRRMIAGGERMMRAGPAGVLVDRPRGAWQLHPL